MNTTFLLQLSPGWDIEDEQILYKKYTFPSFKEAFSFVSAVSELAEQQHHHPDICFGWGYVTLSLTTHYKKALTDKDLSLAIAIDQILV